jgi:hypothetical protein
LRLHNQAEAYGTLPSVILGLETLWGAWQLNEVTLMVGRRVEKNMTEKKDPWAGFNTQPSALGGKLRSYRSMKTLAKKKVKIREDGTW